MNPGAPVERPGSVVVLVHDPETWPNVARRLRDEGLYPEPVPADEGLPGAWQRAAVRADPTLVLAADAVLLDGWSAATAGAFDLLAERSWHVLLLDPARPDLGHVVVPDGAARLAESAGRGVGVGLDDVLASTDLEVVGLEPAMVAALHDVPRPLLDAGTVVLVSEDDLRAAAFGTGGDIEALVTDVDDAVLAGLVTVGGRVIDGRTGRAVLAARADDPARLDRVTRLLGERPPDALSALLRYDGAIGVESGFEVVADELVCLPFWTPTFCRAVVSAAEALDAWQGDDLDPVPGAEVSLAVLCPRLFAHVEDHLAASIVPQLRRQWPTLEFHGLRDAFVIKYTEGDTEGLRLHHDVAQVSGAVRLNDGYEGGALVFPRQDVSNERVPVGRLLAWPSLVTHPHAGEPVRRGVKYSLTVWFEVPGTRAN